MTLSYLWCNHSAITCHYQVLLPFLSCSVEILMGAWERKRCINFVRVLGKMGFYMKCGELSGNPFSPFLTWILNILHKPAKKVKKLKQLCFCNYIVVHFVILELKCTFLYLIYLRSLFLCIIWNLVFFATIGHVTP